MLCWLPFVFLLFAYFLNSTPRYISIATIFFRLGIIFTCLIVVNNNYGTDIANYKDMYNEVDLAGQNLIGLEIGYKYLMILFKFLFVLDFNYFMLFITFFSILSFLYVAKKYSRNIILSILIFYSFYYFLYTASALRQCVAFIFTFYSFKYIIENDKKKFYYCIFCAFLFHYSALFFVPAYYVANRINISRKKAILLVLFFIPFMLIDFTQYLFSFLSSIDGTGKYLSLYFDKDSPFYEKVSLGIGVAIKVVFFILYAWTYNKLNKVQRVLFNLYFFYLILYFPLSSVAIISSRGLDYYKIFDCLLLPYLLVNQKNECLKVFSYILILSYLVFSLFSTTAKYTHFSSLLSTLLS